MTGARILQFLDQQNPPLPMGEISDELMDFFNVLKATRDRRRLPFITDSGHSNHGFQLAMSIAKRHGLLLDLVQITPPGSTHPELIPEIVTLGAAGIHYRVTRREGELQKEIQQYVWEQKSAVAYIIDVCEAYWGFLRYMRRLDFDMLCHAQPPILVVENGYLV